MAAVSNVISFPRQEKKEPAKRRTRRADGLFQVELRYKDQNGLAKKKSFYGKSQKEAENKKKAFERDLAAGLKADDKTAFGAYADHWLKTYKSGLKPGTLATYRHDVDLLKSAFAGKQLREIMPSDVQAFINTRAGLSASAIKKSAMTARAIFEAARQDRLILFNPCDQLDPPSGTVGTHRALEPEERVFITTHCTGHRFYYAAMLMLYAGLRRGEAMAMRFDRDIDLDRQVIHVTESAHISENGTDFFLDAPKSVSSVRDIPILPPLDAILAAAPKSGLVLPSAKGEMCTESAFSRCFESYITNLEQDLNGTSRRWATEEQLKHWKTFPLRCHDLRHTFASLCYDADIDPKTTQLWMGHADIMVTLRIYTHLSQQKQRIATDAARQKFAQFASVGNPVGTDPDPSYKTTQNP